MKISLRREPDLVIFGTDVSTSCLKELELDEYYPADVSDYSQILSVIEHVQPNWVFHLAGIFRGLGPDIYRINVLGAINVVEAVKLVARDASVLLVGSAAEYGTWPEKEMPLKEDHECRPVGAYGVSKHLMTQATLDTMRAGDLKAVIARPFNLVGPGLPSSLLIGAIMERAKNALTQPHPVITIGNPDAIRDFVSIEDVVDAYVALMRAERWGEVFNICSGRGYSVGQAVDLLLSFAPRPIEWRIDPALVRDNDTPVAVGDVRKIQEACGFTPKVPLSDALCSSFKAALNGGVLPNSEK